jgi:hypothetical protein
MRRCVILVCVFLFISGIRAQQPALDVDSGKVSGNKFESAYFKFQYEIPQGWSALNDDLRIAHNRQRHDEEMKNALEQNGIDTTNRKTEIFSNYNLLIAGAVAVTSSDATVMPRINIWAHKRFGILANAGDHARFISQMPQTKVLRDPEEVTLAGRKFVRADFLHGTSTFHSQFVTVSEDYLVGFDFRAKTEKEINGLAETMQRVRFN